MAIPCLVLVDGEHYPPVVRAAVDGLAEHGYEPKAGLFLGGTEKADRPYDLGIPVSSGPAPQVLSELIEAHRPGVIIDLSDEPILDYRRRMRLVAIALSLGVAYEGADFRLEPPPRPPLSSLPSVSIVGTGKRTGKTAVSIELARYWRESGKNVAIVTMGRGGPPEPVLLRVDDFEPDAGGLRKLAEIGLHAASDYAEDALLARVDTVGTRRAGGGLAGAAYDDNFHLGVSAAEELHPDLCIYEGSGTTIPPAKADATVLVGSASLDPEYLRGYLGPYRLAIADALVLIEGDADSDFETLESIAAELTPDLPIFRAAYALDPTVPIGGRSVLLTTTAPLSAGVVLEKGLVEAGAARATVVHSLSNRRELTEDLTAVVGYDLVLTEVKAAAVDVVIPWAEQAGLEIGFLHNRVEVAVGIDRLARIAEKMWSAAHM